MEYKNTKATKKKGVSISKAKKTGAKVVKKAESKANKITKLIITAGAVVVCGLFIIGTFVNPRIKDKKVANSIVKYGIVGNSNTCVLKSGFTSHSFDFEVSNGSDLKDALELNNVEIFIVNTECYTDGGYDIAVFPIQYTKRIKCEPKNLEINGTNLVFAKNGDTLTENGECYREEVVNCIYATKVIDDVNDYSQLISLNGQDGYEIVDIKIIGDVNIYKTKDISELLDKVLIADVDDTSKSDSTSDCYPASFSLRKR